MGTGSAPARCPSLSVALRGETARRGRGSPGASGRGPSAEAGRLPLAPLRDSEPSAAPPRPLWPRMPSPPRRAFAINRQLLGQRMGSARPHGPSVGRQGWSPARSDSRGPLRPSALAEGGSRHPAPRTGCARPCSALGCGVWVRPGCRGPVCPCVPPHGVPEAAGG